MTVDDGLRDDALRARQRRPPLGVSDAIHAEHAVVFSQVAPRGEVGAVGTDHDVLRLDLALGLDAADLDVADPQQVVLAHGTPDDLGDLGIGIGHGLDQEPNLFGGRACLLERPLGHRGHDLLQRAAGVPREEHVLGSAQCDGHRDRLAGVKLSGGRLMERSSVYPPVRPCFVASGTPAWPSALRSRSIVRTLTSKWAASCRAVWPRGPAARKSSTRA
jgi:hypothetical protein